MARSLCFPMPLYSGLVKSYHSRFICPVCDGLCTLCPDWPVYAVLHSDKWRRHELISCSCLTLGHTSANNRVSSSDTVSQLKLKLRRTSLLHCHFPCNGFVSVQTGLKRESDNKGNKTPAGGNGCSGVASQRVSCYNISLLREVTNFKMALT